MKSIVDNVDAAKIIGDKKTSVFKSLLKKPKKSEVHVDSIQLFYEGLVKVSGLYEADFFRKATHAISVDSNVKEVFFGGKTFSIKEKSALRKAFVGSGGKNKVDIPLEEHVYVEEIDDLFFDYNGTEIDFPLKINSKTTENYPDKILKDNTQAVKTPKITFDSAIQILQDTIKKPLHNEIRNLKEKFTVLETAEIYVPIYEARLTGPKNKAGILRLDGVRKKIL
jgi:hypothetical protein